MNYDNFLRYYNYENNNYNLPTYDQNLENVFDPYNGLIRGNMFQNLYNAYKVNPIAIKPANEQAEILTYIDALTFACVDLNLYLDNNPNDKKALELYSQYSKALNEYLIIYQKQYGKVIKPWENSNPNYWEWNSLPWPWEKGE